MKRERNLMYLTLVIVGLVTIIAVTTALVRYEKTDDHTESVNRHENKLDKDPPNKHRK